MRAFTKGVAVLSGILIAGGWRAPAAHAQPVGACCCSDGTCVVLSEADCAALRRGDVNCDGAVDFGDINVFVLRLSDYAQYQAQYPACLGANGDVNGDGAVDFMDINPFAAVLIEGHGATGTWRGEGTSCTACWQPLGACCLSDGTCVPDLPATECELLGGQWQGVETTCDPNPCPQPSGACCYSDGHCELHTQAECNLLAGDWLGAEVPCEPNPCEPECADWHLHDSGGPSARAGHALAFDAARGVTVLFGGDYYGETWEWDGQTWTRRLPETTPPWRSQAALAYDAARGVVVLFGGVGSEELLGDTWTWDGTQWTELFPEYAPTPRAGHALTYDAARGVIVLFGGVDVERGVRDDTWEWNGSTWVFRDVTGPSPRFGHAVAYDAGRGVMVLFGGLDTLRQVYSGETWEWDGTSWTLRSNEGPAPRAGHALAYDAQHGVTILFGGQCEDGTYSGETWLWDGTTWTLRSPLPAPTPRVLHAMAYDALRAETALFGGAADGYYSDTWTLALAPAPEISEPPVDVAACVGESVQLSVQAQGIGTLTYQWYRDGVALVDEPPVSGATTSTLTIDPLGAGDTGSYTVAVTDLCGSTTSAPAALAVQPLTQITAPPQALTRCVGQSAAFSVAAEGACLTYHWRKDGVPLEDDEHVSGATTPSLSVASVALSDSGSYDVIVTGACGSQTSLAALLDVLPATVLTAQPQSVTATAGRVVMLSVLAAGSDLTYQWHKDGLALTDDEHLSGAADAVLILSPVALVDAGNYSVLVTGTCGAQLSAAATLTVLPDRDGDGIPDDVDNCPDLANESQVDSDADGVGDACDGCPHDPDKLGPGICDCGVPDTDRDADGTPDCVDGCPADPDKTEPGSCGCGHPDTDSDGDGAADCEDGCPDDFSKRDPGVCGCGRSDLDSDNDGIPDCVDNCPNIPNRDQADTDGDGTGDACDDDQTGRPRPPLANSSFMRGLIDLLTGDDNSSDANYSRDVLARVVDALESGGGTAGTGDQGTDGTSAATDGTSPDQAARPTVGAVCPATSSLLLGLTLLGLYLSGAAARRTL